MPAQSLSHVWLFVTLWTVACQAPLSMEFYRQEYWNGLSFPPPCIRESSWLKDGTCISCIADRFFATEPQTEEAQRGIFVNVVQLLSTSDSAAPWTAACQASLSFTITWSLLKFMSTGLVMLSNQLILCHFLLLLPSTFPNTRVFLMSWLFASGSQSIGTSASASVLSMNISGLISFRIDWFGLLAVQGTLKSPLQWEKKRVGWFERIALKHMHCHMWNR